MMSPCLPSKIKIGNPNCRDREEIKVLLVIPAKGEQGNVLGNMVMQVIQPLIKLKSGKIRGADDSCDGVGSQGAD